MPPSRNQHESQETYTLQGTAAQTRMVDRSAEKDAAFFLPYLEPGMTLVDCGSGPGSITIGLAELVEPGQVIGIDIESAQVDEATARASRQGVTNVRFETGSVYALPLADSSVDAVFSNAAVQHFRDPMAALREMYRTLKSGGVIGVRTSDVDGNLAYPYDANMSRMRQWVDKIQLEQGHNNRIGKQLRELLRRAGFERIISTASYECFGTAEEVQRLMDAFADTCVTGFYAEQILERGWADEVELQTIAESFRQWGRNADAFYAPAMCEAVAWRE